MNTWCFYLSTSRINKKNFLGRFTTNSIHPINSRKIWPLINKKSHQSSLRLHSFITFVFISLLQNDLVALVYSCFPCCCCCLRSYLPYRNQRFGHMASRYASVSKSSPFNSHRSWAVSFRSNQTGSLSSRRSHLSSSHRQTRASVNSNKSTLSVKNTRTLLNGNNK